MKRRKTWKKEAVLSFHYLEKLTNIEFFEKKKERVLEYYNKTKARC
jgi:hypothetical protein